MICGTTFGLVLFVFMKRWNLWLEKYCMCESSLNSSCSCAVQYGSLLKDSGAGGLAEAGWLTCFANLDKTWVFTFIYLWICPLGTAVPWEYSSVHAVSQRQFLCYPRLPSYSWPLCSTVHWSFLFFLYATSIREVCPKGWIILTHTSLPKRIFA